ncbi:MAG: response regulator [Bdellovibrionales bacterium]|nr:response regulator [Bdellovibrionales bacterium]
MEKNKFPVQHILFVDDEADLLDLLKLQFEMEGFSVSTAVNGAEALEVMVDQLPHVIVSDFNMPVMNGKELLAQVKSQHPNIPFILFISDGTLSKEEALKLGCTEVLEKPFAHEDLLSAVLSSLDPSSFSHVG